jgi:hypothetical protein
MWKWLAILFTEEDKQMRSKNQEAKAFAKLEGAPIQSRLTVSPSFESHSQ